MLILDSSEENSEIICEHYEKEITCPPGQSIKVAYANYGRTSDIPCQGKRKYITTNCKSKNSLTKAKDLCEGKRSCRLKALNSFWENTCPGVIKYLDIRYQCIGKIHEENGISLIGGKLNQAHPLLSNKTYIMFSIYVNLPLFRVLLTRIHATLNALSIYCLKF